MILNINNENYESQLEDYVTTLEVLALTAGQELKEKFVYLQVSKTLLVMFSINSIHI